MEGIGKDVFEEWMKRLGITVYDFPSHAFLRSVSLYRHLLLTIM
jgi:hypothetical protein